MPADFVFFSYRGTRRDRYHEIHKTSIDMKSLLKENALAIVLIFLIIGNFGLLLRNQIMPLQQRLTTVRKVSWWERSSRLSFGDRFTEYLQFVLGATPNDSLIVIPPVEVDSTYGNQGIMQFFLFPRDVSNCPSVEVTDECLQIYRGEGTYILSLKGFPNPDRVEGNRLFLSFEDDLGIYLPIR